MACFTVNMRTGFSIVECLLVVALSAIMAGIAWSTGWQQQQSLVLQVSGDIFLRDMLTARSEAMRRGLTITLCKSADGQQCNRHGDWEQGWLMFVDRNGNAWVDDDLNAILSVQSSMHGLILSGNTPVRHYLSWHAQGESRLTTGGFQAGTLTLCSQRLPGIQGQAFTLSASGRVRRSFTHCGA
ncbi:MAG: hypothetical protein RIQ52_1832 [Pseudomonadota bacterium]|jgi:type IV fimbrial biogenesis protein FimT